MEQMDDDIVSEREAEYVPDEVVQVAGPSRVSISKPIVTSSLSEINQEVEMNSSVSMITESTDLMDIFGTSSMENGFDNKVNSRRSSNSLLELPPPRVNPNYPIYPDTTLSDKLEAAEATNSRLVDEIDRILRRNTEEKDDLKRKCDDDIRRLRNQLKESNERYTKLLDKSEKLDTVEFDMHELKNACENLKRIEIEQQNKIEKLSNDNLSFRADVMTLKNEVTKFRAENSHLKAAHDTVIAENAELRSELMNIKTSNDTNKDLDRKRMDERIVKLNEDVVLYENKIAFLEAENGSLRRRVNDMDMLDREFNKLKRHTTTLESEIRSLMAENGHLRLYSSGVPLPGGGVQTTHLKSNYSSQFHDHADYSKDNTFQMGHNSQYNHELLYDKVGSIPTRDYNLAALNNQRDYGHGVTTIVPSRDYSNTTSSSQREYNATVSSMPSVSHSRDSNTVNYSQNVKSGNYSHSVSNNLLDANGVTSQQVLKDSTSSDNRSKSPGRKLLGDVVAGLPPKPVSNTTPFGTDNISATISKTFDELEKKLTALMSEKTALQDETEKLHQRGGKTLKERTRLTQAEARLKEVGKEISATRKELLGKPS